MADYNIYIHDLSSESSGESPTKAWTQATSSQTKAWSQIKNADQGEGGSNQWSVPVAAFKGVSNFAKSHPVIMAAIIVTTTAIKAIDTIEPFVTRETGDYRFNMAYNNVKTVVGMAFKPFSTVINAATGLQSARIYNEKQEQHRLLVGEALTNNPKRRI